MVDVQVNLELCNGCGGDQKKCIEVCALELWKPEREKVHFSGNELCMTCRFCEAECPTQAIKVVFVG
ncbi:MAG: ATP-binding protein [Bacillota bacterium]